MGIHKLTVSSKMLAVLGEIQCWAVDRVEVERLALQLVGDLQIPMLRRGGMRTIIAGKRFGADANRFAEEFELLAQQCAAIRDGSSDAEIFAAAFFHLRHGNIHPLSDCNGRLGRLLLAEQFYRYFGLAHEQTLAAIHANESEYRAAFTAHQSDEQFQRMVTLLARVAAVRLSSRIALPFSILPVFEEPNTTLVLPRQRSAGPKAPTLAKRSVAVGVNAALLTRMR